MMTPLVFFDVDKTLMAGYSGFYAALRLIRCGAVRKRRLAKAIFYKAISPLYRADVRVIYENLLGDMAGWPLEKVMAIGAQCFEEDLRPRLYQEGLDLVARHREQNHPCYLVSSGPYMVLKALGDYVGANPDWTPCPEVENGVLQKRVREPLAYKEGKLQVAAEIAAEQGLSLKDCYFYTDSIDDMGLLEAVGYPHVVNPDRALKRRALAENWPILTFTQCLGREGG